jgi:hypothetical protein
MEGVSSGLPSGSWVNRTGFFRRSMRYIAPGRRFGWNAWIVQQCAAARSASPGGGKTKGDRLEIVLMAVSLSGIADAQRFPDFVLVQVYVVVF